MASPGSPPSAPPGLGESLGSEDKRPHGQLLHPTPTWLHPDLQLLYHFLQLLAAAPAQCGLGLGSGPWTQVNTLNRKPCGPEGRVRPAVS